MSTSKIEHQLFTIASVRNQLEHVCSTRGIRITGRQELFDLIFSAVHECLPLLSFYEIEYGNGATSLALSEQDMDRVLRHMFTIAPDTFGPGFRFSPRPIQTLYSIISLPERFDDKVIFRKRWNFCFKASKKYAKSHRTTSTVQHHITHNHSSATTKDPIYLSVHISLCHDENSELIHKETREISSIGFTTYCPITCDCTSIYYSIKDTDPSEFVYGEPMQVPLPIAIEQLQQEIDRASCIILYSEEDIKHNINLPQDLPIIDISALFSTKRKEPSWRGSYESTAKDRGTSTDAPISLGDLVCALGIVCKHVEHAGNAARCIMMAFVKMGGYSAISR